MNNKKKKNIDANYKRIGLSRLLVLSVINNLTTYAPPLCCMLRDDMCTNGRGEDGR